ncbi:hypothetical protein NDU88_009640 [Pleurodeles waltl]|uniref:Uncharacterized protein n=1 Tax=Pleurodeles waltl TaxID=8319 RepID=A0AAV7PVJ6_PLEWA|nr:hypothetical protein NDU88_009640 [Pleurodeles waltl]
MILRSKKYLSLPIPNTYLRLLQRNPWRPICGTKGNENQRKQQPWPQLLLFRTRPGLRKTQKKKREDEQRAIKTGMSEECGSQKVEMKEKPKTPGERSKKKKWTRQKKKRKEEQENKEGKSKDEKTMKEERSENEKQKRGERHQDKKQMARAERRKKTRGEKNGSKQRPGTLTEKPRHCHGSGEPWLLW